MKVYINQSRGCWVLCITRGEQVIRFFTQRALIDLLDIACTLQLHVDNIQDLPLTQYLNQGGSK